MSRDFLLGCHWRGVLHNKPVPVEEQFKMIRDAGVFDYLDRLPPPELMDEYAAPRSTVYLCTPGRGTTNWDAKRLS
jgi:hypothetical protein